MLSHLLARDGIDSVVVDNRTYTEIEQTVRAGILEAGSVTLLVDSGVSHRVLQEGDEHAGIEIGFDGELARIDFADLVGASSGSTRRPTCSSTSPRPGPATVETYGSGSPTPRSTT